MANKYVRDPVAMDSDEKRIKKTEAAAEKRAVKDRQKRSSRLQPVRGGGS